MCVDRSMLFQWQLFAVVLPAIVGSGMFQIATFTDLYFASFIPGATASISCEQLKLFTMVLYRKQEKQVFQYFEFSFFLSNFFSPPVSP